METSCGKREARKQGSVIESKNIIKSGTKKYIASYICLNRDEHSGWRLHSGEKNNQTFVGQRSCPPPPHL